MIKNIRMREALEAGTLIDVSKFEEIADGEFVITGYQDDIDYADCTGERWIWFIGIEESTGRTIATTHTRYYDKSGWRCLWLR